MMNLKELFSIKEIFDPLIYYKGEVYLGDSLYDTKGNELALNAKEVKGKNAYLEFLKKYYFNYMQGVFTHYEKGHVPDLKYSVVNKITINEKGERVLRFCLANYLFEKLHFIGLNFCNLQDFDIAYFDRLSDEELINIAKDKVREWRSILQDVKDNGKNSSYYEQVQKEFAEDLKKYKLENILKAKITVYTEFLVTIKRYLLPLFSKDLPLEEFVACYDYDKLCLLLVYELLRELNSVESFNHGMFLVVQNYVKAVDTLRKKGSYNPYVVINSIGAGKNYNVNVDKIIFMYEEYLKKYPLVATPPLNEDKINELLSDYDYRREEVDPKTEEGAKKIFELLDKQKDEQMLLAKWEFFPKGERIVTNNHGTTSSKRWDIDEEELLRRMKIAREFIESSNYYYVTLGKDTFLGYMAYLYRNGKVIFMRDYTQIKTKRELLSSGIYVMNYEDFINFSRLSKTTLITYLNDYQRYGVKRIYHYKNMDETISRLQKEIVGNEYREQVKRFIERLIESGELSRK